MLLHERLAEQERSTTIGELFEVTKKPRRLELSGYEHIPFVPMDAIPQGGAFAPRYDSKPSAESGTGTYFEKCDVLVGKITPSFENGKQALVCDLPAPFGFATTEVIPLRPKTADRDRRLLFYYLLHPDIRAFVAGRMEGATGRKRVPEDVLLDLPYPAFECDEERVISDCLRFVRCGIDIEQGLGHTLAALKRAAMNEVFSTGVRGEAQKDSEIGPLPASWEVWAVSDAAAPLRFDRSVQLQTREYLPAGKWPIIDQGQKQVAGYTDAEHRVIKSDSPVIIFGDHTRILKFLNTPFALGADGTKPLTAREGWNPRFLYHALCQLDIPSRGYNRHFKQLAASFIPKPSAEEQSEIAEILDTIDAKIDLHQRKKDVLEELFRSLLHKLMTDEIRVSDLDLSALQSPEEEVAA